MLIRRFGQNRRNLGIAILAIAFIFCVYLYYDLVHELKQNEERNQRLKALQNSLSTQLQVIYEHKSRLERAIQDEKDNHHKTKEAKQDLEMKYTREKQDLQSRFQSMNQKQRMLQTQFDDLQKEFSKSEAEYQLLKTDYQREIEEYKEKIFIQSQQCDKDRKYLGEEIDDFKQSQKDIRENLVQCQEALRISRLQIDVLDQKNEAVFHRLADKENKAASPSNKSQDSFVHINKNPITSSKAAEAAFAGNKRKTFIGKPEINNDEKRAPTFHPDKIAKNLINVGANKTARQPVEEDEQQLQQAAPPPRGVLQRQPAVREVDTLKHRNQLVLGRQERPLGGDGANAAVIDAPNAVEQKQPMDKNLDEDEDPVEVGAKNGQNEADQKDEDDYQYDKNADDEEKSEEKGDDFPDAILANKNINKIQNPVYPDDVEVFNH